MTPLRPRAMDEGRSAPEDADLIARRADFPVLERFTWLQNGGVSLVPRPVHETHLRLLEESFQRGPSHIAWPAEEYPRRAASRARISGFLGVDPVCVAITRGVSEALQLVLRSIDWSPGDEIVISDDEEAAIALPALHLRDARGIVVRRIALRPDSTPAGILDATSRCLGPRTRLVAISHVTTDWGVRLPAAEIVRVAEGQGIPVFVDIAHSAGTLPLDLAAMGASYAGLVSYKWMLAPYAAGALVVRADRISETPVVWAGGRAERLLDYHDDRFELHADARRFEYGPWSWPLVHAWAAGLDHLDGIGVKRVADRAARLTGRLIEGLLTVTGVALHTPVDPQQRAALVAFTVPGWSGASLDPTFGPGTASWFGRCSTASMASGPVWGSSRSIRRWTPRSRRSHPCRTLPTEPKEDTVTDALRLPGRYYRIYPKHSMLGHATDDLTLPLAETALLLIDVYGRQYEDDPPAQDGLPAVYRSGPDDTGRSIVRDRIVPAREAARRAGLRVIYLTNALRTGLSEGNEWRTMSVRTCGVDVLDVWQEPNDILAFSDIIAPGPGERLIEKQVYSGFFETHLDSTLRGFGIRNLIVAGGDGLVCLGTTCIDAMYRDYRVVGLRDAILTGEWPETRAGGWRGFMAIRQIETTVGYTATTDEFIAACDGIAATPGGTMA